MLAERIDAARLARLAADGAKARWRWGPGRLGRLDRVREPGGRVELSVDVRLAAGPRGTPELAIEVVGLVDLVCQRCLEACEWDVDISARLAVVGSEAEAAALDEPLDVVVCDGPELDLVATVEDELLAAMPMAPRHPPAQCARAVSTEAADGPERHRPFAVLDGLLAKDEGSKH